MTLCIVSTLRKVVGYYHFSVLSMSVMGFSKNVWMGVGGWVGWGELYPNNFFCWNFLTLQNPLCQGDDPSQEGITPRLESLHVCVYLEGGPESQSQTHQNVGSLHKQQRLAINLLQQNIGWVERNVAYKNIAFDTKTKLALVSCKYVLIHCYHIFIS